MTLVSDSRFFGSNGATTAAVTSVMVCRPSFIAHFQLNHISTANGVFQATNWQTLSSSTVVYSNLQVSTRKIVIYSSTATDPYYSVRVGLVPPPPPRPPPQAHTASASTHCSCHLFLPLELCCLPSFYVLIIRLQAIRAARVPSLF
jgi:hypothetical protein